MNKKNLISVGILLMFVITISGCTSPSTETSDSAGDTYKQYIIEGQDPDPGEEQQAPEIYYFNERIVIGDLAYTFHDMTVTDKIGKYIYDEFIGDTADGLYVIFDVTIENVGANSIVMAVPYSAIINNEGDRYLSDVDGTASMSVYYEKEAFYDRQLHPKLPIRGVLVFDVPKDLSGYIEISGDESFASEKKYVSWKNAT